ncbi:Urb2/Npa2 family-domain-containing protein [Boeremia exigua]|uniref:Urb2/Npa2 family-domain-containing protein n=1 Tax=Boeremia exigua TaxID=749465 RepID=UPI001E8DD377|nr:Urb2/Npa2 family-domain-containing protein [Boeremia exigua]KAH6642154.1 Urb2/Npa2 family-domain-containing protein [Boeremia exigua]
MAPKQTTSENGPAPTRPRLQAINQNFSDVNEQVEQAAQIIGLPDYWTTIKGDHRAGITKSLVRARAEWVLRWALDKLKDESTVGRTARGTTSLWKLLDWMIHVLPVSRSAPHLRDAAFPAILERTLIEHFDPRQTTPASDDVAMTDASGSSDTVGETSKPSKKRKRGAAGADGSAGQATLGAAELQKLFLTTRTVIESITSLSNAQGPSEDTVQAELMKVALRTESAQAASILKNWLMTVETLLALAPSAPGEQHLTEIMDLSLVIEIWELRTAAANDDSSTSADEFSTECLVPALTLLDTLKALRSIHPDQSVASSTDRATQIIEKLLARHLFAPARAAFLADTDKATEGISKYREATLLVGNLGPLRAKLLQAAQIEDDGELVPAHLAALSGAASQLLSLAIRVSPSKTPRSKLAEKPWIEAVFIALVECAGCSLTTPPTFATPRTAIEVLVHAVGILRAHSVSVKSDILKDLFWYHSGIKYPIGKDRQMHWSLVAALIELDPSVFVTEPKSLAGPSKAQQTDLAQVIFEELSKVQFEGHGFTDNLDPITSEKHPQKGQTQPRIGKTTVLDRIIVPLMSGFATNRNLLGFIRRWDEQLVRAYRHENRKALKECKDLIWEDRSISQALAQRLEQSLTQGQIANLLQEHAQRMDDLGRALSTEAEQDVKVKKLAAYKKAASTAVIVPAILQSITSDEIIGAVKSQMRSLLQEFSTWVQDDRYSPHTRLSLSWLTLCQLLSKLWPLELHSSVEQQEELLSPLIEQSLNDVSAPPSKRVDSPTRAAAMLFLLDTCDHLQTLPGSEDLIWPSLDKILQILSTGSLDSAEHVKMIGFFCADFVQLFGRLSAERSQRSLQQLLVVVSSMRDDASLVAIRSLSQVIFEQGASTLQDLYLAALLKFVESNDSRTQSLAITSLYFVRPSAISREKREAVLDSLTEMAITGSQNAAAVLSIMVQLMETSNATAKVSSDGAVLFEIAQQVQDSDQASSATLYLLQQLVQLTLGQVVLNQTQSQNMIYLGKFKGKLDSITSKSKQCSAANLAILRAVGAVQKQNMLLQPKQFISVLKASLTSDSSTSTSASLQDVIEAFNEIPTAALVESKLLDSTQSWLRTWISDNADLESYMITGGQGPRELAEYVARLHTIVAKYKLYPNTQWIVKFTLSCLRERVAEQCKITTISTMKDVFARLPVFEKLDLVHTLTHPVDSLDLASSYRLLTTLVSTFEDRHESNVELRNNQLALLPKLCDLLIRSPDHASFNALLSSINTILSNSPSLVTQHGIETIISALSMLSSRSSPQLPAAHAPAIHARLCETTRLILLLHRGRLGGRLHILLPLLQNLLFLLFTPHSGRGALPSWLRGDKVGALTDANGAQYARVLATLCNPPQSSIQKTHTSGTTSKTLNDPVKAAREKTSAYLYPLLSSYSRFQLSGRIEANVREKLMPGIWEVVGTASLSRDGLDAMFAGLGRSERDVWRSVWGEWESVHGRKDLLSGDTV